MTALVCACVCVCVCCVRGGVCGGSVYMRVRVRVCRCMHDQIILITPTSELHPDDFACVHVCASV